MIKVSYILDGVNVVSKSSERDFEVSGLQFDSREIQKGDLFVAISGVHMDGHNFIDKAISLGAAVIVCEVLPVQEYEDVLFVKVKDASKVLAQLASNFFRNPSRELKLVGVTGTNGKTTVATLLYNLFTSLGFASGLLSTVKVMVGINEFPATHTTPDSISINRYLRKMIDSGIEYCFMEVSSHGIDQNRVEALSFQGGVFTNLSHDHLDYHNSFAEYRDVKKRFFDKLPKTAFALYNKDDRNGSVMVQNTKAKKFSFALKSISDFKVKVLENQFSGMNLMIDNMEVWTKLVGGFNAYNILAIYAVTQLLDVSKEDALTHISNLDSVSGRFQYFVSKNNVTGIIDYAHTPDALKNVLETINEIRTTNENLTTVVGCGGDRDMEKRPKMGYIASVLSSKVIFSSDNPRSEDPYSIIEQMENGVSPEYSSKILSIENREQAIKAACQFSKPNDIILVAGKGHETYQEIKGQRYDFNDLEILKKHLNS